MKLDVKNFDGQRISEIELNPEIFGIDPNFYCISNLIRWQQFNSHNGTSIVKTRSTVSGTGKKNFRQKGTGSARRGSLTVSQFRGGGVIFGPTGEKRSFKMNKKERALAMKSLFSLKFKEGNLFIVDSMPEEKISTKNALSKISIFGDESVLFVDVPGASVNFSASVRNLPRVNSILVNGINGVDMLSYSSLVLTIAAFNKLNERFGK